MDITTLSASRLTSLHDSLQGLPASARTLLLEILEQLHQREQATGQTARSITQSVTAALTNGPRSLTSDAVDRALAALADLLDRPRRRRVVVTGLGAITPVGHSAGETWRNLLAGQSGVDRVTLFDASPYATQIGAEVKDWDPLRYLDRKEARRMARCSQFAVGAAAQALEDAGLSTAGDLGERTGVILGTGLGGFDFYEEMLLYAGRHGKFRVTPMTAVGGLPNMPAYYLSQLFGAQGPLNTVVTACAAGTQAIGEGLELIRRGAADRVLTGGVEGLVCESFFAGFSAMRAISTRNHDPQGASRPFDSDRDGFIIGEGAAVMVLESLESALARGARIYAEVMGHSASADAFHIAAPEPNGEGAQRAMRWALEDAHLTPEDLDYINAHGTSTPLNDKTETHAIKEVFGEHAYEMAVSSTKSMIGHSFGGAGAIEGLAVIMSAATDQVHPTINYETPDPACDLDYVPNHARQRKVTYAMSNSFGLGGQNACLVVGKYNH